MEKFISMVSNNFLLWPVPKDMRQHLQAFEDTISPGIRKEIL
jgi:hypothetical protein